MKTTFFFIQIGDNMSYDIEIVADCGDPKGPYRIATNEYFNITYNVRPMFVEAFQDEDGIRSLHNKKVIDCLESLDRAIRDMEIFAAKYDYMNPKNGWGSYLGTLDFLRKLRATAGDYPFAKFWVE
jgi:hypothetical protein